MYNVLKVKIITHNARTEMTRLTSKLAAAGLASEAAPKPGLLGFCLKLSTM